MNLLIKGVRVIDSSKDFLGDVYIEYGKIKQIGFDLDFDCEKIFGEGKVLMPSFIDMHTHFREPGFLYKEDIETGSLAAVRGGYTGVNLMANTNPLCSSEDVLKYVYDRADEVNLIDINQCVSITKDFDGVTLSHLDKINPKFIKAISDDGKGVQNSKVMFDAMKIASKRDWLVISHAESNEFTTSCMRLAENLMTQRDIALAKESMAKLHMAHVSTKEAMKYIIDAKNEGVNVTCEVTPHHIALNSEISNYRVNPPIREKEDVSYLIKAIQDGYVDSIGTDHAPHSKEDKEKGAPGLSGIETSFSVCYTKLVKEGYISLNKLSEIMSKKPAKLLSLNKGCISPGYDGDLALIDLSCEYIVDSKSFKSKGKNTPFDGMKVFGKVLKTIRNGKVVYNAEEEF